MEINQRDAQRHHRGTRLRYHGSFRSPREDELVASLVHHLSQPLASMLANAQAASRWLKAEPPNLLEATASIDRIAQDAITASESMQRIRSLFKHEPFETKEVSILVIMSEAVRVVQDSSQKRQVSIEWHFEDDAPNVSVDPLAIQEVFINLISNAMEALENANHPRIQLRAGVTDNSALLIQVIDNGPGINETEKIFEWFVTTKRDGLGIGLAVSRAIAEAHGGRLWAENDPAGGAKLSLELPVSP